MKAKKIGFYGKNEEHLKKHLGEMGRNEHIWPKMAKFWSKNAQKVKFENPPPPKKKFRHFLKDQKIRFYGENEEHL